jgi:hypothetical protein
MADQAIDTAAQEQLEGMPTLGVRTCISFLLFLHLFAISAAVAMNFAPDFRSGIRAALVRVPGLRPYLDVLAMNSSFGFNPVYGTQEDYEHSCEVLLNVPDEFTPEEAAEFEKITLMPEDTWPGMRRWRYSRLSLMAGFYAGDDTLESLLPHALGSGLLREHAVEAGNHHFRCRSQAPVPMRGFDQLAADIRENPFHESYFDLVFDASFSRTDDKQPWTYLKQSGRGEMTRFRPAAQENNQ